MINRISSVEVLYNTPFLTVVCEQRLLFWNVKTTSGNLSVLVNVIKKESRSNVLDTQVVGIL